MKKKSSKIIFTIHLIVMTIIVSPFLLLLFFGSLIVWICSKIFFLIEAQPLKPVKEKKESHEIIKNHYIDIDRKNDGYQKYLGAGMQT